MMSRKITHLNLTWCSRTWKQKNLMWSSLEKKTLLLEAIWYTFCEEKKCLKYYNQIAPLAPEKDQPAVTVTSKQKWQIVEQLIWQKWTTVKLIFVFDISLFLYSHLYVMVWFQYWTNKITIPTVSCPYKNLSGFNSMFEAHYYAKCKLYSAS